MQEAALPLEERETLASATSSDLLRQDRSSIRSHISKRVIAGNRPESCGATMTAHRLWRRGGSNAASA
jgi:hypothetical protein